MQSQFERELLKTLKSIDGTLKRIEKFMIAYDKMMKRICNAVFHAMNGEKYTPIQLSVSEQTDTQISNTEFL